MVDGGNPSIRGEESLKFRSWCGGSLRGKLFTWNEQTEEGIQGRLDIGLVDSIIEILGDSGI